MRARQSQDQFVAGPWPGCQVPPFSTLSGHRGWLSLHEHRRPCSRQAVSTNTDPALRRHITWGPHIRAHTITYALTYAPTVRAEFNTSQTYASSICAEFTRSHNNICATNYDLDTVSLYDAVVP